MLSPRKSKAEPAAAPLASSTGVDHITLASGRNAEYWSFELSRNSGAPSPSRSWIAAGRAQLRCSAGAPVGRLSAYATDPSASSSVIPSRVVTSTSGAPSPSRSATCEKPELFTAGCTK